MIANNDDSVAENKSRPCNRAAVHSAKDTLGAANRAAVHSAKDTLGAANLDWWRHTRACARMAGGTLAVA